MNLHKRLKIIDHHFYAQNAQKPFWRVYLYLMNRKLQPNGISVNIFGIQRLKINKTSIISIRTG
jgi:lipoprotein NlpI